MPNSGVSTMTASSRPTTYWPAPRVTPNDSCGPASSQILRQPGQRDPQEQRREDDVDQQFRQRRPHLEHRLGQQAAGQRVLLAGAALHHRAEHAGTDEQADDARDDRAGQEQALTQARFDPHHLAGEEEDAETEQGHPNHLRRHPASRAPCTDADMPTPDAASLTPPPGDPRPRAVRDRSHRRRIRGRVTVDAAKGAGELGRGATRPVVTTAAALLAGCRARRRAGRSRGRGGGGRVA